MDQKIECHTPNPDRQGTTRIAKWKYDLLHSAILAALDGSGDDGLTLAELKDAVRDRIDPDDRNRLGSLGWHLTTVKLNMEVSGEIGRVKNSAPQRVVLG